MALMVALRALLVCWPLLMAETGILARQFLARWRTGWNVARAALAANTSASLGSVRPKRNVAPIGAQHDPAGLSFCAHLHSPSCVTDRVPQDIALGTVL